MNAVSITAKKSIDYFFGGICVFLAKPLVMLLGKIIRRSHDIEPRGTIAIIKIMGGGSLVIAYPALVGLREKYRNKKLILITGRSVKPFADVLGIFDAVHTIDDRNLFALIVSSVRLLFNTNGVDTVIDFEVHSRLSCILSLLTLARNRIGFYMESSFWRKDIYTRLLYFNSQSPAYLFYEQIAYVMRAEPVNVDVCRNNLRLDPANSPLEPRGFRRLVLGPGCSEFGQERQLTALQWEKFFLSRLAAANVAEVDILGAMADKPLADEILAIVQPSFPQIKFKNWCGELPLARALVKLRDSDIFWGIDSSLLHFARLLGVDSVSIWGPTNPATRLKPYGNIREEIVYQPTHCSPCIQVTEIPPCGGNNVCIKALFDTGVKKTGPASLFTMWPGAS
jgi:ADP-heptose:LPS heptosyltransferase